MWKRLLEKARSVTQESNSVVEGAKEWTLREMTRKIPLGITVPSGEISLPYPPRSIGCAQQVEFITKMRVLASGIADLAFNHSPKEKI